MGTRQDFPKFHQIKTYNCQLYLPRGSINQLDTTPFDCESGILVPHHGRSQYETCAYLQFGQIRTEITYLGFGALGLAE